MKTFIYGLVDPRDNQIKYIGKSNNPKGRLATHYCDKRPNAKLNWLLKLKTFGLKPEIIILDEVTIDDWHYWEQWWYEYFKAIGAILKNGDIPGKGQTRETYEQRRAKSARLKNKSYVERYGEEKAIIIKTKIRQSKLNRTEEEIRLSSEKRKKTIADNIGLQEEINKKISLAHLGKTTSDLVKSKIRDAINNSVKYKTSLSKRRKYTGVNNPMFKGNIYQYSKNKTELIKIWESLGEISEYDISNISACIRGKLKSAYGFYWTREILN